MTVPPVAMLIACVAPLLPTLNRMLSVVPTPEVDCSVRDDAAAVPPIISGEVTDVAKDGVEDVEMVTAPVAPETLIFVPATAEVTPVFVTVTAPVAPETLMPVPATLEVTPVLVTLTAPVADVLVLRPELVVRDVTPLFVIVTAPVAAETPMPVPATAEVTPVLAIEIEPAPLVTLMAVPAVNVVRVKPVPLPISSAPLAGVVVKPVPPLATASVPASVTAPVVAVLGVNPVVPAENDATVLAVVASVPDVGKVTLVSAVVVNVSPNAPDVVKEPASETALPPILPTVVAKEPDVFVTSPVSAGKAPVGKVDAAAAVPAAPVPT